MHLSCVHLVDDDPERPHVHHTCKRRFGVRDEEFGGLVCVRPAVGKEDALVERLVPFGARLGHNGYPKIGDREMAFCGDEDISWLQIAMDDAPLEELVHGHSLFVNKPTWALYQRQLV